MATLYYTPFQKDDPGELPSPDAIENILPDYKYIFYDPNRKKKDKPAETQSEEKMEEDSPVATPKPSKRVEEPVETPAVNPSNVKGNVKPTLEESQMGLLDYQMRELENYRQAVHKMGKDILMLRDHIHDLEDDNSSLRRQLNRYDETRKELMATSAADFDAIDKNELIVRYMTLKQRVQTQSNENIELKSKIQKLQAEILKRDEREKKYDELKRAHVAQLQVVHKLQDKAEKAQRLEKACFQQEKLFEQLEKAESRVITLERTLADNSRVWARERQDLQTRLREAEHGFARTNTMVLHDYPTDPYKHPQDLSLSHRGFRSPKLDPIRKP
ncbi:CCDC33 [Bugula neritina]|uniref:CCDC33 n=1 Tax=Bugula neritina TaxID=10212 RepID=A0A7J7KTG9_BUGNE|nr:CCDC33 [Bugula neritina]